MIPARFIAIGILALAEAGASFAGAGGAAFAVTARSSKARQRTGKEVILGRRGRVQLAGELNPPEGMIHLVSKDLKQPASKLPFQLGTREFIPSEIESMIRIDEPEA